MRRAGRGARARLGRAHGRGVRAWRAGGERPSPWACFAWACLAARRRGAAGPGTFGVAARRRRGRDAAGPGGAPPLPAPGAAYRGFSSCEPATNRRAHADGDPLRPVKGARGVCVPLGPNRVPPARGCAAARRRARPLLSLLGGAAAPRATLSGPGGVGTAAVGRCSVGGRAGAQKVAGGCGLRRAAAGGARPSHPPRGRGGGGRADINKAQGQFPAQPARTPRPSPRLAAPPRPRRAAARRTRVDADSPPPFYS